MHVAPDKHACSPGQDMHVAPDKSLSEPEDDHLAIEKRFAISTYHKETNNFQTIHSVCTFPATKNSYRMYSYLPIRSHCKRTSRLVDEIEKMRSNSSGVNLK